MKEERRAGKGRRVEDISTSVVVDAWTNGAGKIVDKFLVRMTWGIGLTVTLLLAIFGFIITNAVRIAEVNGRLETVNQHMSDHERGDDERDSALGEGIRALKDTDQEILLTLKEFQVEIQHNKAEIALLREN